jgi:predicted transcriptional regulator
LKIEKSHKLISDKANQFNLANIPVSQFMNTDYVKLKADYTIKGTIETFRNHHISGAPVVDYQNKIIGVVSEYDLLLQAASDHLSDPIHYQSKIIAVHPETTLKEVLIILYKQKLKWMPVINKENFVQGVVFRIDVLNFIALHS